MRGLVIAAVIVASVAGAALAQTRVLDAAQLEWQDRPGAGFARRYPDGAASRGISGAAVVCCTFNAERRLDCRTAFEWPVGYGFGEATIDVMRDYRLTQASYDRLMSGPDRDLPMRRTMRWVLPDEVTPETTAAIERISAASENMCGAP